MRLRWYHHLCAVLIATLWSAGLLALTVSLHQRLLPPKTEFKRRIAPAFATIRRPPPPRVPQPSKPSSSPKSSSAASLLPVLKLDSPVPLPSVVPSRSVVGLGLLHPGGKGTGGSDKKSRKTLVLTADLVDKAPRLLVHVPPVYPAFAESQNLEGAVVVRLLVGLRGFVKRVEVLKANPPGVFELAAKKAVFKWRFRPGQFRGRKVLTWVRQRISFRLR